MNSRSEPKFITKKNYNSSGLYIRTLKDTCSDLCFKRVLLCDDIPFNLIPLETMLQDQW